MLANLLTSGALRAPCWDGLPAARWSSPIPQAPRRRPCGKPAALHVNNIDEDYRDVPLRNRGAMSLLATLTPLRQTNTPVWQTLKEEEEAKKKEENEEEVNEDDSVSASDEVPATLPLWQSTTPVRQTTSPMWHIPS